MTELLETGDHQKDHVALLRVALPTEIAEAQEPDANVDSRRVV